MSFKIYIPTYKRAGKMLTHKVFPEAIIVCPESQVDEYRKYYPDMEFMPCPDSVEGNTARKRNWVKDNADTDYLIMVDDDIRRFYYADNRKQHELSGEHLREVIENGFIMAEDLGTVLWGINLQTDLKFYREYSPFSLTSVVLGPFTGHIKRGNNLRYDERLPLKEDYDYSLQVLWKYRKLLRFNKYSYEAGHINNEDGGCVSIRTWERELEQNILLQKKWGKNIVKFDMERSINPIVTVPLKGI